MRRPSSSAAASSERRRRRAVINGKALPPATATTTAAPATVCLVALVLAGTIGLHHRPTPAAAAASFLPVVRIISSPSTLRRRVLSPSSSSSPASFSERGAVRGKRKGSGGGGSGSGFGNTQKAPPRNNNQSGSKTVEDSSGTGDGDSASPSSASGSDSSAGSASVALDRWGLPPPTVDDIFPPLPEGTELVPAQSGKDYTLPEINDAIRRVVPLSLDRCFDEFGTEKVGVFGNNHSQSSANRAPMKLRLLHASPPVLRIDNFLTPEECDSIRNVAAADPQQISEGDRRPVRVESKTFAGAVSTRTSTSWFCLYRHVPVLLAKAVHLLGLDLASMEEPQIVRYRPGQEFSYHYDEVPPSQLGNGGQRLATLLYVGSKHRVGWFLSFAVALGSDPFAHRARVADGDVLSRSLFLLFSFAACT
jgi:hypothetical protein